MVQHQVSVDTFNFGVLATLSASAGLKPFKPAWVFVWGFWLQSSVGHFDCRPTLDFASVLNGHSPCPYQSCTALMVLLQSAITHCDYVSCFVSAGMLIVLDDVVTVLHDTTYLHDLNLLSLCAEGMNWVICGRMSKRT